MLNVLTVIGTRPEAIKLFPLIRKMDSDSRFHSVVASTGQQGKTLGATIKELGIKIDHLKNVLRHDLMPDGGNDLNTLHRRVMVEMAGVIQYVDPDVVVVHGDTTTAMATAGIAATVGGYPVVHVEAGNRSGNKNEPFPEEINRLQIAVCASLHFAATQRARENLLRENIPDGDIYVTGNTVVDSMKLMMADNVGSDFKQSTRRQLLVTMHRKENMNEGHIDRVAESIKAIMAQTPDLSIKWLKPSNPNALPSQQAELEKIDGFEFIDPQPYRDFLRLIQSASLLICDSGGAQEEAFMLGTPTIVARGVTERPEAFNNAAMFLIKPDDPEKIVRQALKVLEETSKPKVPQSHGFGDGNATDKILNILHERGKSLRKLPHPKDNPGFYMDWGSY